MLDCPSVETVVVVKWADIPVDMTDGRYVWYEDLMEGESKEFETVEMNANDPLYILYTSVCLTKFAERWPKFLSS